MEREDGYPMICEAYGMEFKGTVDVDIALKYQAMANQEIDVTNAFTTDAQLAAADVLLLQDDKSLFATYYAGTVVRNDTLEKYPGLADTLEKLTGQISDDEMREMNYQVEVEGKDEKDIARDFLTPVSYTHLPSTVRISTQRLSARIPSEGKSCWWKMLRAAKCYAAAIGPTFPPVKVLLI